MRRINSVWVSVPASQSSPPPLPQEWVVMPTGLPGSPQTGLLRHLFEHELKCCSLANSHLTGLQKIYRGGWVSLHPLGKAVEKHWENSSPHSDSLGRSTTVSAEELCGLCSKRPQKRPWPFVKTGQKTPAPCKTGATLQYLREQSVQQLYWNCAFENPYAPLLLLRLK